MYHEPYGRAPSPGPHYPRKLPKIPTTPHRSETENLEENLCQYSEQTNSLLNERHQGNNLLGPEVYSSISPEPYLAGNYKTTDSVNTRHQCFAAEQQQQLVSASSPPRSLYEQPRKQLIHELSSSPPKPPSALPYYSVDRSFEELLEEDRFKSSKAGQFLRRLQPLETKRITHSCPPSPKDFFNQPQLDVTVGGNRPPTPQAFFPDHDSYTGRFSQQPFSSMSGQSSSGEADQPQLPAVNGSCFDEMFAQSSGSGRTTSAHPSLINNDQKAAADSPQLIQGGEGLGSHSTTLNSQSPATDSSCVKGGARETLSKEYKEWTKLLLPEKPGNPRGHRPLNETRSAELDPQNLMVRQGSDKRLFLSPETAEGGVVGRSPRLPQRTRSLRNPAGHQKASVKPEQKSPRPGTGLEDKFRERIGSMPDSAKLLTPQKLPVVSRRGGSFRTKRERSSPKRLDEWPQPEVNVHTQRFLQLPDADDYSRLRSFTIDEKGCVINRGDSFRLRSNTKSTSSSSGSNTDRDGSPRSGSPELLQQEHQKNGAQPAFGIESEESDGCVGSELSQKPERSYEILVLGSDGCGKTSLINQFMTSEHRNPFSSELDNPSEDIVSIVIEGKESELKFTEIDAVKEDSMWLSAPVSAYLVLYSVDSKTSFKHATNLIADIRERHDSLKPPVILAANKIDLARTRVVQTQEARSTAQSFRCEHYEFSVALNHGVDDLLIGILAEINRDPNRQVSDPGDGFRLSIRRFSQRKQRQNSKKRGSAGKGDKQSPRGSVKDNKRSASEHSSKTHSSKTSKSKERKGRFGFISAGDKISGFTDFMNKLLKRRGSGSSCENLHK